MKKLLTLLTLVLTLTFFFSATAFASGLGDYNGGGEDGDVGTHDGVYEGITPARSGYLIWLSDGSGRAINGVVACATADGSVPHTKTGAPLATKLITRFGETANFISTLPVPWSVPPFTSANTSNEGAVRAFLTSPQPQLNYDSGAAYVCDSYLGIPEEQLLAYVEQCDELYLNVSPWAVGGVYGGGGANSYLGIAIAGTDVAWATYTDSNNYLSRYTHGTLSNSFHYVESWLGLAVPSSVTGKHSSGEILQQVGWGIVSVRVKEGDKQIVKVYKTDGVVDRTSYSMTSAPVDVKNEGDYIVKKWNTSKEKTKVTSVTADYPEVTAGCPLVQSGSGPAVVQMKPEEKAIFVLLEREKEPMQVDLNSDAIRAHELNVIFRYSDGLRDETVGAGRAFEGVDFIFNNVKSQYEKISSDTIKDYKMDEEYRVLEEVSGATAECGRPDHYYNEAVGKYLPWEEDKYPFGLGDEIDPHYAINVSRVYWEDNLHTVEYRDPESMNGYVEEVLGITPSLIGEETSANPGSNVESTLPEVQTNTYDFKTSLWHSWYERSVDYVEEVEDADGNVDEIIHYTPWVFKEEEINHPIANYSVNTFCNKYKVMVTPQASIESAGTVLEELRGNTVLGHDAITKQIVSTQLGGTLTFYPEVPMVVWYTSDLVNYAEPELKPIFVLGEYGRKCTPPVLHGYNTGVTRGGMKGITYLPASATGRVAENVYKYYVEENGHIINGVTPMGSTFETTTTSKYTMVIGSAIFDCADEYGVESAWNNDWVDPRASHDAYEASITSRLDQQLILQFFDGGKKKHGDYYVLTADYEDIEISPVQERVVVLEWKEGAVQNIGEVYEGIEWAMGAPNGAVVYENWGLDEMLDTMYISTTDAKDENASGNDLSADSPLGRANPWFDEESITMCIRFYRTDVTCGCLIGDDKVDYNMLGQSNINRYATKNTKPENSLEARIYARLYLIGEEPSISADGYTFEHTSTFRCDEVQGARFAVVNSTTAQSRK